MARPLRDRQGAFVTLRLGACVAPPSLKSARSRSPIALKTLGKYCGFYNAHNEINGSNQTTNLGVRSSNLFGRAST
jgi:hypothetical protein